MNSNRKALQKGLLESEEYTPQYKEKYEREMKEMVEKKLSRFQRIVYYEWVLFGLVFFLLFGTIAVTAPRPIPNVPPWIFRAWFGLGSLLGLVVAFLSWRIARRGTLKPKTDPRNMTQAVYGSVLIMMVLALLTSGRFEDPVKGLNMLLSVFVFFFMGALFMLKNIIEQSELKTREKLLEIEYRVAQMQESLEHRQKA